MKVIIINKELIKKDIKNVEVGNKFYFVCDKEKTIFECVAPKEFKIKI